jgi:ribosomal protein L24
MKFRGSNSLKPKINLVKPITPKLFKGDTVKVVAGMHKGKSGKVLDVIPDRQLIVVENVAMVSLLIRKLST